MRILGDVTLSLIKKVIPSAELRHQFLPYLALCYRIFSYKYCKKLTIVKFSDGCSAWKLKSPILLAAGANKNAKQVTSFEFMGFGGITVGSVTQKAHQGNPHRPRIVLLSQKQSIQNSMGLGNLGAQKVIQRLKQISFKRKVNRDFKIGLSLSEQPQSKVSVKQQILEMFDESYPWVDYLEINLSCPNTGTKRADQYLNFSQDLIQILAEKRKEQQKQKPLFIKLSPDMKSSHFSLFLKWISQNNLTGVVLSNTYPLTKNLPKKFGISVANVKDLTYEGKKGGLSGSVLYSNTLAMVKKAKKEQPHLQIIAVGGVDTSWKVQELLNAGASLVQCYSVLAYSWNAIGRMLKELSFTKSNL